MVSKGGQVGAGQEDLGGQDRATEVREGDPEVYVD